jgi:hypothetical protein
MTAGERRVTIAAIAVAAGVSIPTVSRVLNGRSDVSAATRERVEQLLRDQGYQRRNSRQPGRAQVLDVVFDELDSSWAVELIRGVSGVAHAAGAGTVVTAVHRDETATRQWLRNLRTRACDGVVFVLSEVVSPVHLQLRRLHIPVVVVDPSGRPVAEAATVGATNWRAAAPGWTATGPRWPRRASPPTRNSSCRAISTTSPGTRPAAGCSISPSRRPPSSPPVTRWRWVCVKPPAAGGCGCPPT